MILPKGTPVWINLNAFFVDVDLMLIFLKKNQFTGFVKFEFAEDQFMILIDEGDVVAGAVINTTKGKSYGKSVSEIVLLTKKHKNIKITISKLLSETVGIYEDLFNENFEVIHKDLHSDFSNIIKFINKQQNDKFNGYIQLDFINSDKNGIIIMNDGKIRAALTDKIQLNTEDSSPAKLKLVNMFLMEAQKTGVIYNVFKLFK